MKTDDNGIIREMTDAETEALAAELAAMPETGGDTAARLDNIEATLTELAALLGGDGA